MFTYDEINQYLGRTADAQLLFLIPLLAAKLSRDEFDLIPVIDEDDKKTMMKFGWSFLYYTKTGYYTCYVINQYLFRDLKFYNHKDNNDTNVSSK